MSASASEADPSIADLTFSAEIRTDRYEDLVQLLQTALGLKVVRVGDTISIFRGTSGTHKRLRT
jgi:ferric-dicitrate binding protein FerR (iron transport regulator)